MVQIRKGWKGLSGSENGPKQDGMEGFKWLRNWSKAGWDGRV
jgi:hypothetical protein